MIGCVNPSSIQEADFTKPSLGIFQVCNVRLRMLHHLSECYLEISSLWNFSSKTLQRSAKVFVRGCEKFVIALAYLFCLALVGSCLARFAYFLADLCTLHESATLPLPGLVRRVADLC